jgi:hypothetical protein
VGVTSLVIRTRRRAPFVMRIFFAVRAVRLTVPEVFVPDEVAVAHGCQSSARLEAGNSLEGSRITGEAGPALYLAKRFGRTTPRP